MEKIPMTEPVPASAVVSGGGVADATVSCRCGCVPANLMSLFQMSELREKKKSQDKKFKKALAKIIDEQWTLSNLASETPTLDLHDRKLASCHLFFDNFLHLGEKLTVLHLDHNLLNFIPNGILKSVPLLRDLSLHDNQLEVLPDDIGMLIHLENLRLERNSLRTLPVTMKDCSSLVLLNLSENPHFCDIPMDLFENMSRLHHILANQCPFLHSFPPSLCNCELLEFVSTDATCLDPPLGVLATGHDAIQRYFDYSDKVYPMAATGIVSDNSSSIGNNVTVDIPPESPSVLFTDTHEIHKNNALQYLELKRNARMTGTDRCEKCWHVSSLCICDMLPQISLSSHIEIVVYMDSKEVFNAGDDAKLLSICCPKQTKRFIYAAQDVELVSYVAALHASNPDNQTVVLFPSKRAVSADDFMKKWTQANVTRDTIRKEEVCRTANSEDTSTLKTRKLTIIVVDAVWRHARRMAQRLHVLLPHVPHVQLSPEQFSVYARKQSQPDRICTVEATALFLSHIGGASPLSCEQLVESVRINNIAVRPLSHSTSDDDLSHQDGRRVVLDVRDVKKSASISNSATARCKGSVLYTKDATASHPCWYYGLDFFHGEQKLKQKNKLSKQKRRYL